MARSLACGEAGGPRHVVGDVSALWTTPRRGEGLPVPDNSPLGSFEQGTSGMIYDFVFRLPT